MNNIRMDNVVAIAANNVWSVDGYGATDSDYVEKLSFCPMCDLQGWLEGTVLDGDTQPVAAAGQGIESLSGSFVTFDPQAGGDPCHPAYPSGTYCFRAESFTNDFEYRYSVWLKFPASWSVQNAYVVGTPVCDSGATWGSFQWVYETNYNEIQIYHPAYMQTVDHCVATYCVGFSPPKNAPEQEMLVSWYWTATATTLRRTTRAAPTSTHRPACPTSRATSGSTPRLRFRSALRQGRLHRRLCHHQSRQHPRRG